MEKFRTFLKRSGALMSALVLLLCCTVPASAAGGTWGVPFDFSSIWLAGNASTRFLGSAPFPLDSSGPNSVQIGGISVVPTFSNNEDGMIDVEWSLSSPSLKMQLDFTDVVVPASAIWGDDGFMSFRLYSGSSSVSFDAEVSYKLQYPVNRANGGFAMGTFVGSVNVLDAAGVNLTEYIAASFADNGFPSSKLSAYVLLSDLTVTFSPSESFERFNMRQFNQTSAVDFSDWFESYNWTSSNVTDVPGAVDFTSWLRVAIGGFLDTQLWPGMSLDNLLWLSLTLGLLFAFLKFVV